MKKVALVLTIVLCMATLVACGGGAGGGITGTWSVTEYGITIEYKFDSNGTGTVTTLGMSLNFDYKIDGNKLTLEMFGESEAYTYAISDNTLTLTDESDTKLELKRK